MPLFQICEELMMRCLAPDSQMGGLGCDNMTVILICFINNKNYDHLAERCGQHDAPLTEQKREEQATEDLNSSSNSLPENEK